jgi:cytochrome c oxidase subunit 1
MAAVEIKTLGLFPRPKAETGLLSWITTVDHKRIGILYGFVSFLFFLIGGSEAFVIRLQLMKPENNLVSAETFNALFTMHATTMIFMAVMPLLAAFMNFLLPLMIGARDVAFPRLNAFSFWSFLFGGIFINTGWFMPQPGSIPATGWFAYAPLTSLKFAGGLGPDFWSLGLLLLGFGTLVSGFNFLVTIINMRAPGMSFMKLPIFVWTTLVTSVLIIFAFPAITVALVMVMFDRNFATNFFNIDAGASVVFWQHLFWTFGHPEVYILILPAMGIVSEVLPTFSRKPLFGYSVMVFSTALIGFLGFTVWSHHMFAVGMGPVVNSIFSLTTMAISVPTGVKIFNWLSTMAKGRIKLTTAMLFSVGFLMLFTIGGLSGFMHAAAPSDTQQTDTYFVVAHIHYVLIGGSIFAIFSGFYYWFPKMFGRLLNETLGKWNFWIMFIGFNTFAFPFHFLGLMGMPRRNYTYPSSMGWDLWNYVSTIGVFILTVGILIFIYNTIVTFRNPRTAGNDPWDARTIEWSIPSPPPDWNFDRIPVIHERDEVWYQKYPERLGGETIAPEFVEEHGGFHMPGSSFMPVLLAFGVTVMAYGMLFKRPMEDSNGWLFILVIGLILTVLAFFGWAFEGAGGTVINLKKENH